LTLSFLSLALPGAIRQLAANQSYVFAAAPVGLYKINAQQVGF